MPRDTFCSYCGARFADTTSYPRMCTACGAHMYGPVEKDHAFKGLSFIHPELFTEPG